MKSGSEIVRRIDSSYVRNDCVQVMIPYKKGIILLNPNGILYSHKVGEHVSLNKYMDDTRRAHFPYSNIPTHFSKSGLFGKKTYTNQILEYEIPYIKIGDDSVSELFAVKDDRNGLVIDKDLVGEKRTFYATRNELEEIFSETATKDDSKKIIIPLDNDSLNPGQSYFLPSEDAIYEGYKSLMNFNIQELKRRLNSEKNDYDLVRFLKSNPMFLEFIDQSLKCADLSNMDINMNLLGSRVLIAKVSGNDISLYLVNVKFISADKYRLEIVEFPVTKYTLEQLKHLSPKITNIKEPSIPLRLNPGISKQDVEQAKNSARILRKY